MKLTSKQQLNNAVTASDDAVLQFLQENGIIDLSGIREEITEMNIEKFITENHSHRIWQGKNGRWLTYIYDPDAAKHRRLVSKRTKKELLDFLYDDFSEKLMEDESVTIRQMYPLWLEHKKLETKDTSVARIESDWKKFYENDPIVDVPIRSFTKMQLEDWILHLITDNEMTKTNYYNVSLIIRQIMAFAYYSEMIDVNPFDRVRKNLGKFFKRVRKPADESQVYSNEEIQKLEKLIWTDFYQKGRKVYRLAPLAVLFQLYTGMRVSEVCALKYEDILPNGKIHVQRMLVKSTGKVREGTKGHAGEREVYLSEKALKIINATLQFRRDNDISVEEFIFSETDAPFPERTINDYLERYCKRINIPYRSSHKLRKTALSSMVNAGISLNTVKNFAGHVDEETTLKYYTVDREAEAVRNEQIERALSFGTTND